MTERVSNEAFADALFSPSQLVPRGITSWNSSDPIQRFSVYRNNITQSLVEALIQKFPVTHALVGDAFFREMAKGFVSKFLPRSRVLAEYGDDLPIFIRSFGPAAELPYLSDVAELEAARVRAYHAQDAGAMGIGEFAIIDGETIGKLHMILHPSVQLINSPYAIFSLWAAHQGEIDIGDVDPAQSENVLVTRPYLQVEVSRITAGTNVFLTALDNSLTLGEAATEAVVFDPSFDLTEAFRLCIETGAISGFGLDGES